MAKSHRGATALAPLRPIIIQGGPSRAPARRRFAGAVARGGRAVGRGGRALARRAAPALPVTAMAVSGAALGWADGAGHLDFIPAIGGSRIFTLGAIGFGLSRLTKNKWVRGAGIALLLSAAVDFGREQGAKNRGPHGASGPSSDGLDGDY